MGSELQTPVRRTRSRSRSASASSLIIRHTDCCTEEEHETETVALVSGEQFMVSSSVDADTLGLTALLNCDAPVRGSVWLAEEWPRENEQPIPRQGAIPAALLERVQQLHSLLQSSPLLLQDASVLRGLELLLRTQENKPLLSAHASREQLSQLYDKLAVLLVNRIHDYYLRRRLRPLESTPPQIGEILSAAGVVHMLHILNFLRNACRISSSHIDEALTTLFVSVSVTVLGPCLSLDKHLLASDTMLPPHVLMSDDQTQHYVQSNLQLFHLILDLFLSLCLHTNNAATVLRSTALLPFLDMLTTLHQNFFTASEQELSAIELKFVNLACTIIEAFTNPEQAVELVLRDVCNRALTIVQHVNQQKQLAIHLKMGRRLLGMVRVRPVFVSVFSRVQSESPTQALGRALQLAASAQEAALPAIREFVWEVICCVDSIIERGSSHVATHGVERPDAVFPTYCRMIIELLETLLAPDAPKPVLTVALRLLLRVMEGDVKEATARFCKDEGPRKLCQIIPRLPDVYLQMIGLKIVNTALNYTEEAPRKANITAYCLLLQTSEDVLAAAAYRLMQGWVSTFCDTLAEAGFYGVVTERLKLLQFQARNELIDNCLESAFAMLQRFLSFASDQHPAVQACVQAFVEDAHDSKLALTAFFRPNCRESGQKLIAQVLSTKTHLHFNAQFQRLIERMQPGAREELTMFSYHNRIDAATALARVLATCFRGLADSPKEPFEPIELIPSFLDLIESVMASESVPQQELILGCLRAELILWKAWEAVDFCLPLHIEDCLARLSPDNRVSTSALICCFIDYATVQVFPSTRRLLPFFSNKIERPDIISSVLEFTASILAEQTEDAEWIARIVFTYLSRLLSGSEDSKELLCSKGFIRDLFCYFADVAKDDAHACQESLLALITELARYSISYFELSLFLNLFAATSTSYMALCALHDVAQTSTAVCASHYVDFGEEITAANLNSDKGLRLANLLVSAYQVVETPTESASTATKAGLLEMKLTDVSWPPAEGFTFIFLFQMPTQPEEASARTPGVESSVVLFSWNAPQSHRATQETPSSAVTSMYRVVLDPKDRILGIHVQGYDRSKRTRFEESARFDASGLLSGDWCHVTVVHSPGNASSPAPTAALFVDGMLSGTAQKLNYPATAARANVEIAFNPQNPSRFRWRMSNCFFLKGAFDAVSVFGMYALAPSLENMAIHQSPECNFEFVNSTSVEYLRKLGSTPAEVKTKIAGTIVLETMMWYYRTKESFIYQRSTHIPKGETLLIDYDIYDTAESTEYTCNSASLADIVARTITDPFGTANRSSSARSSRREDIEAKFRAARAMEEKSQPSTTFFRAFSKASTPASQSRAASTPKQADPSQASDLLGKPEKDRQGKTFLQYKLPAAVASTTTNCAMLRRDASRQSGICQLHSRLNVRESLVDVGGMGALMYLLAKATPGEAEQATALNIVISSLRFASMNLVEFESFEGYELIAEYLRSRRSVVGWQIMDALFSVSLSDLLTTADNRYAVTGNTVIRNPMLVASILLDWRIWSRADKAVWGFVVSQIASIVQPSFSAFAEYNQQVLRDRGMAELLLFSYLNDRSAFPGEVTLAYVRILHSLLVRQQKTVTLKDFKVVLDFMLASHLVGKETKRTRSFQSMQPSADHLVASTPQRFRPSEDDPSPAARKLAARSAPHLSQLFLLPATPSRATVDSPVANGSASKLVTPPPFLRSRSYHDGDVHRISLGGSPSHQPRNTPRSNRPRSLSSVPHIAVISEELDDTLGLSDPFDGSQHDLDDDEAEQFRTPKRPVSIRLGSESGDDRPPSPLKALWTPSSVDRKRDHTPKSWIRLPKEELGDDLGLSSEDLNAPSTSTLSKSDNVFSSPDTIRTTSTTTVHDALFAEWWLNAEANGGESTEIRHGMLGIALDAVSQVSPATFVDLGDSITREALLVLLDTSDVLSRVMILKILDQCLRNIPHFAEKFRKLNGFGVAANILGHYECTPEVFFVCCDLFTGQAPDAVIEPAPSSPSATSSAEHYNVAALNSSAGKPAYSGQSAAAPILMALLSASWSDVELVHLCINTISRIFHLRPDLRTALLDCNVIEHMLYTIRAALVPPELLSEVKLEGFNFRESSAGSQTEMRTSMTSDPPNAGPQKRALKSSLKLSDRDGSKSKQLLINDKPEIVDPENISEARWRQLIASSPEKMSPIQKSLVALFQQFIEVYALGDSHQRASAPTAPTLGVVKDVLDTLGAISLPYQQSERLQVSFLYSIVEIVADPNQAQALASNSPLLMDLWELIVDRTILLMEHTTLLPTLLPVSDPAVPLVALPGKGIPPSPIERRRSSLETIHAALDQEGFGAVVSFTAHALWDQIGVADKKKAGALADNQPRFVRLLAKMAGCLLESKESTRYARHIMRILTLYDEALRLLTEPDPQADLLKDAEAQSEDDGKVSVFSKLFVAVYHYFNTLTGAVAVQPNLDSELKDTQALLLKMNRLHRNSLNQTVDWRSSSLDKRISIKFFDRIERDYEKDFLQPLKQRLQEESSRIVQKQRDVWHRISATETRAQHDRGTIVSTALDHRSSTTKEQMSGTQSQNATGTRIRNQWNKIAIDMMVLGSVWEVRPDSWMLDPTEGPQGMRVKLMPCFTTNKGSPRSPSAAAQLAAQLAALPAEISQRAKTSRNSPAFRSQGSSRRSSRTNSVQQLNESASELMLQPVPFNLPLADVAPTHSTSEAEPAKEAAVDLALDESLPRSSEFVEDTLDSILREFSQCPVYTCRLCAQACKSHVVPPPLDDFDALSPATSAEYLQRLDIEVQSSECIHFDYFEKVEAILKTRSIPPLTALPSKDCCAIFRAASDDLGDKNVLSNEVLEDIVLFYSSLRTVRKRLASRVTALLNKANHGYSGGANSDLKHLPSTYTVVSELQEKVELQAAVEAALVKNPLAYLFETDAPNLIPFEGDVLRDSVSCTRVSPFGLRSGELIFSDRFFYFREDKDISSKFLSSFERKRRHPDILKLGNLPHDPAHLPGWSCSLLTAFYRRRYMLQNLALELFFSDGSSFFVVFEDQARRETAHQHVLRTVRRSNIQLKDSDETRFTMRDTMKSRWVKGELSNFEYLMFINKLAGRTFNDLSQYPIFPYLLAQYDADKLDPRHHLRDLRRPMGDQSAPRRDKFAAKFSDLQDMAEVPYHYGTHYSCAGNVLHYTMRLEPFTQLYLEFHDGRFDYADRTFQDLQASWRLASAQSTSDVRELIPEFFCLPEMFENANRLDFGLKQNGQDVSTVVLPPWAKKDARLFVYYHRELLESSTVSEHLCHWIDLIFGDKQSGPKAVDALNVFHPLTYEGGVDLDAIQDPIERESKRNIISSFGQTPRQLFDRPHEPRGKRAHESLRPLAPSRTKFEMQWNKRKLKPVCGLLMTDLTENTLAVGACVSFYPPDPTRLFLIWGSCDGMIRLFSEETGETYPLLSSISFRYVFAVEVSTDGRVLVVVGLNGLVSLHDLAVQPGSKQFPRITASKRLYGHHGDVISLKINCAHRIFITGGQDNTAIIWDLGRRCLLRKLEGHEARVTAIAASNGNGEIVTVCPEHPDQPRKRFVVRLWTINAKLIARIEINDIVNCVTIADSRICSRHDTVLLGLGSGTIELRSILDLSSVVEVKDPRYSAPVLSLTVSPDNRMMISGHEDGRIVSWVQRTSSGKSRSNSN
eukprot:m.684806 g.684806  ORF g.684806 m.684806 type:complete len:3682 (+) comp58614_c0_seq1:32-11077(+)